MQNHSKSSSSNSSSSSSLSKRLLAKARRVVGGVIMVGKANKHVKAVKRFYHYLLFFWEDPHLLLTIFVHTFVYIKMKGDLALFYGAFSLSLKRMIHLKSRHTVGKIFVFLVICEKLRYCSYCLLQMFIIPLQGTHPYKYPTRTVLLFFMDHSIISEEDDSL